MDLQVKWFQRFIWCQQCKNNIFKKSIFSTPTTTPIHWHAHQNARLVALNTLVRFIRAHQSTTGRCVRLTTRPIARLCSPYTAGACRTNWCIAAVSTTHWTWNWLTSEWSRGCLNGVEWSRVGFKWFGVKNRVFWVKNRVFWVILIGLKWFLMKNWCLFGVIF